MGKVSGRVGAGPRKKLEEAAAYLETPDPTEKEASALGLTVEEASGPPFEIWPDNWQAVTVYCAMRTQWINGFAGPTGLNYASLPEVWRRLKVPTAQRDQVFQDLQVMEAAGLKKMHEKSD